MDILVLWLNNMMIIVNPMKKPLREKGNEKKNKLKEKEKGLMSKNLKN